jgi:hypothetical protein
VQFAKKNHGSVNSMITWLLGKAIRNIHAEALQEEFANEVIRENITAQCNPAVSESNRDAAFNGKHQLYRIIRMG